MVNWKVVVAVVQKDVVVRVRLPSLVSVGSDLGRSLFQSIGPQKVGQGGDPVVEQVRAEVRNQAGSKSRKIGLQLIWDLGQGTLIRVGYAEGKKVLCLAALTDKAS